MKKFEIAYYAVVMPKFIFGYKVIDAIGESEAKILFLNQYKKLNIASIKECVI